MTRKPTPIPKMTRAEIMARAEAKQGRVLDFLGSGEVWTTEPILGKLLCLSAVGADPNLSHRADPILSQGWKPTLRGSAVDKCRGCPGSVISLLLC